MNCFEKAKELYTMLEEGKLPEAKEKYYHDEVIVIQADGKIRKGKTENLTYDKNFIKNIEEIYGGKVLAIASDEKRQISMVEFWIKIKQKDGTKKIIAEVAIQQWEKDKIIEERFYSRNKSL
ncbi:MAG: hypothetical protein V2I54_00970 [Bacteroidales bacterium]|jgi:hypothetical protein|nr:hypothetical protein [Bacteroidales bacterium]